MKLGFYTYSYVDRLKMEIEPVLEAVAAAGYDGIDVSATWHDDLDPALMPPDARARYVTLDGVWIASLVPTPQAALWLAADVGSPHFKHNYDPCYLAISGHELSEASPPLLPSTAHVHVKDYSGRYPDYRHLIPGDGVVDHRQYLTMLREAGFDGYVVNECFIDAPLERACRVGYQTLAEAMRACGVRTK